MAASSSLAKSAKASSGAGGGQGASNAAAAVTTESSSFFDGLSSAEQSILKTCVDEEARANGWIRMFPCSDGWEFYSHYLENRSTSYNLMLHKKLFPRRWQSGAPKKNSQSRAS